MSSKVFYLFDQINGYRVSKCNRKVPTNIDGLQFPAHEGQSPIFLLSLSGTDTGKQSY